MTTATPEQVIERFSSLLARSDLDALVDLYEPDAVFAPQPGRVVTGRAARVELTPRARAFRPAAERVLAELEAAAADLLGERRAASLRRAVRQLADLEAIGERETEPPRRGAAMR